MIAFLRIRCNNSMTHHWIFLETPFIFLHAHYSRLMPINLIRINHADRSYLRSHGNSFTVPCLVWPLGPVWCGVGITLLLLLPHEDVEQDLDSRLVVVVVLVSSLKNR